MAIFEKSKKKLFTGFFCADWKRGRSETWIGVGWLQYLPLLRKRVATKSPLDIKKKKRLDETLLILQKRLNLFEDTQYRILSWICIATIC